MRGVIYVALGEPYVKEALKSARSLKAHHPDAPITLFTDVADAADTFPGEVEIVARDGHPLKTKVACLWSSPYDETLFLDTDTVIQNPMMDIFDHLEGHDLCIAYAPKVARGAQPFRFVRMEGLSFNTGVVVFRKSPAFHRFYNEWVARTRALDDAAMVPGRMCDQRMFNQLREEGWLEACGVKVGVLPNYLYNVRIPMVAYLEAHGKLAQARILHGLDREQVPAPQRAGMGALTLLDAAMRLSQQQAASATER